MEDRHKNVKCFVEEITPTLAAEWLKNSHTMRDAREPHIRFLAAIMAAGKWLLTGDTIRFDVRGRLIDGGHRLTAVIRSGATIESLVVRGLSPLVCDFLDQGCKTRRLEQRLHNLEIENAAVMGALLSWLWRDANDNIPNPRTVSIHEGLKILKEEGEEQLSSIVKVACARNKKFSAITASIFAYLGCKLPRLSDQETADRFLDSVVDGTGLHKGDPCLTLRDQLAARKKSASGKTDGRMLLPLVMMGWEDFAQGVQRTKKYEWNPNGKDGDPWPKWFAVQHDE